jgi:4,5-dihydroxyphthalate decarboxylase
MRNAGLRIRRLFRDPRAEEERYFAKNGFYPVMHLLVIRRDTAARVPTLARSLIELWEQAKSLAYEYYEDPNYSLLAWGANEVRAQRDILGADPWPSGIAANRVDLEQFMGYCHDQGLIDRRMEVEALFDESVRDT